MEEVTLMQMLDAREKRVWEQNRLMETYKMPVICFTMNIPGPVKYTSLIARSFRWGLSALDARLPKGKVLHRSVSEEVTGCTAMFAVDMTAGQAKKICVAVEESCPMGRLFDMDVLTADGAKLDREDYGGGSRDCIVCGEKGRGCASRRIHSVAELQNASNKLMADHFRLRDAEKIGTLAAKALLDEVCTTPKPGLVDRRNSGSHRDMDIFTFMSSASALTPYLIKCAEIGMETAQKAPEETFSMLRKAGLSAEQTMWEATGGVNTHKGAIFTMGLLSGAAGRLWKPEWDFNADKICAEVAAMTGKAMEADLAEATASTAGEKLYAQSGIRGVRGEAAMGLPSVRNVGLPAFREAMAQNPDRNRAGVITLLRLIGTVEDTNLLHRGGAELAAEAAAKCREVLGDFSMEKAEALDSWFIEKNLSPGGCADLLAAVYFLTSI